jgi:hypothetical protein
LFEIGRANALKYIGLKSSIPTVSTGEKLDLHCKLVIHPLLFLINEGKKLPGRKALLL